jgi:toxin ParE1/3/4
VANLPLEILPAAAAEALEAANWYRERSPKAALAFARELKQALTIIAESPATSPAYHHGTQRILLDRFPYEVVYRLFAERILVVAVAHYKRRPGYWQRRR